MQALIPYPDISPDVFSITVFGFQLALRWYALAYIAGILIGWRLAVRALNTPRLWKDGVAAMTPGQLEDLLTWIILGVILGGRLGYVLFYQPGVYLENPGQILRIWEGGMSFHGGMIGVVLAGLIYAQLHGLSKLGVGDLMCLGVPPGLLLGRIANFVNAELWGRPTTLPWAVAFPGEAAQHCPGVIGLCGRHPSQLYEALLEGLVLGAVLIWLAWRRGAFRYPGLIAGTFLAGYGIARFIVEFVRQPDAQFTGPGNPLGLAWHVGGWGLTMGQMLSLPMILVGLVLILHARRSTA